MKGGVAAMVLAALAVAESGIELAGELIVSTVTDEEWNGAGALALAARGIEATPGSSPRRPASSPGSPAAGCSTRR